MKHFFLLALILLTPKASHASSGQAFLDLLKSLGLAAEESTKFEASACARNVAICFDAMAKYGVWDINSPKSLVASDLSKDAMARLNGAINFQDGIVNNAKVQHYANQPIAKILQDIGYFATPDPEELYALVVKLGRLSKEGLDAVPLRTLLGIEEILLADQALHQTLSPELFENLNESLLELALARLAVESSADSVARMKAVLAEKRLLSDEFNAERLARFSDRDIQKVSDVLAEIDVVQMKAPMRQAIYPAIMRIFNAIGPLTGKTISLSSYSRLLNTVGRSSLNSAKNGSTGAMDFLRLLSVNLAKVADWCPEILDDPIINELSKTKYFPTKDVFSRDADGSLHVIYGRSGRPIFEIN